MKHSAKPPQPPSERFISPDCRPERFLDMTPASVFAVETLLIFGGISVLFGYDSVWGIVIGGLALLASIIVAIRYYISLRSLFRRPSKDDLHKLYHRHSG